MDFKNNLIQLFDTYNAHDSNILPLFHGLRTAYIEITLSKKSKILKVEAKKQSVIIPITNNSENRTSRPAPHLFHDKIPYVARDYVGKKGTVEYDEYILQLGEFVDSPYASATAKAIYHYVLNNDLLADMRRLGLEFSDNDANNALKNFVYFQVEGELSTFEDKDFINSWIEYVKSKEQSEIILDYITGKESTKAHIHPTAIRYQGDYAKLIPKKENGFPRFGENIDLVTVGKEESHKFHSMLKYIIEKQGILVDGRVFVTWDSELIDIPNPFVSWYSNIRDTLGEIKIDTNCYEECVKITKEAFHTLTERHTQKVYSLELDASTIANLSILNLSCFDAKEYLQKLEKWHLKMLKQKIVDNELSEKNFYSSFNYQGLMSLCLDKVDKTMLSQVKYCLMYDVEIPKNLMFQEIKYNLRQNKLQDMNIDFIVDNYKLAPYLELENTNRSYLFGRLLGMLYKIEHSYNPLQTKKGGSKIFRNLGNFKNKPMSIYAHIHRQLRGEITNKNKWTTSLNTIDSIMYLFDEGDFNDKPLDGRFLAGFYYQVADCI